MKAAWRSARCACAALALGCGMLPAEGPWGDHSAPVERPPDRRDYATFRAAWPDLHEPNYLPFMAHRVASEEGRRELVFCRWDDAEMPLPVHIEAPVISESLHNEFDVRDPARYVAAVEHALATWEREMDGLVRFRRVADARDARIEIRLRGEPAPVVDEAKVLGSTRLADACVIEGRDPDAERLRVHFLGGGPISIYIADEYGLLAEDQVEWIALHELGHALGMRGHSPIPADLMYEVVRDRVLVREGLSQEDSNSFVSLYTLPNGTVFSEDTGAGEERDEAPPPSGPPMLSIAPHVDALHGFRVRLPYGWLRIETAQGVAAVDGVTWDYSASYQVVINRQPDIEAYLARYGAWYASRGRLLWGEPLVVNGRRALRGVQTRPESETVEEVTLVESGDGRVAVVTAECAAQAYESYAPWFEAVLASLELDPEPAR